jgi:hypothetical protein
VASEGVYWTPAHKDPGSQQNTWELLRERLKNVRKPERPRLFVFNNGRQFIRTVPVLPRDEIDMDTAAEDRVGEAGIHPRDERKERFRSRSLPRFPCGTR